MICIDYVLDISYKHVDVHSFLQISSFGIFLITKAQINLIVEVAAHLARKFSLQ